MGRPPPTIRISGTRVGTPSSTPMDIGTCSASPSIRSRTVRTSRRTGRTATTRSTSSRIWTARVGTSDGAPTRTAPARLRRRTTRTRTGRIRSYRSGTGAPRSAPRTRPSMEGRTSLRSAATCSWATATRGPSIGSIWCRRTTTPSTWTRPSGWPRPPSWTSRSGRTERFGSRRPRRSTVIGTPANRRSPPAPQPPIARFTVTPTPVDRGVAVTFNASSSIDPDGTIVSYAWDFGDSSPAGSDVTKTHAYALAGTYSVTLNVTDDSSLWSRATHQVVVRNRGPRIDSSSPSSASLTIDAGSTQRFAVNASDPDGDFLTYT